MAVTKKKEKIGKKAVLTVIGHSHSQQPCHLTLLSLQCRASRLRSALSAQRLLQLLEYTPRLWKNTSVLMPLALRCAALIMFLYQFPSSDSRGTNEVDGGLKHWAEVPHPYIYCSRRPIQLECVKSGNEDPSHQCVCRHPVTQRPRLSEETSPSGSEEEMPIQTFY